MDDDAYINAVVVPPSPPRSVHDFHSPYVHDYNDFVATSIGSPSFHGSYYSPYSNHSDLSYDPDANLGLIDTDSPIGLGLHTEYDPNEFDASQTASSSLLMYQDTEFMPHFNSLTASPSDLRGSSYDYSSPSSTGDRSPDRRSRASSVSSSHANNNNAYTSSPGLEVAHSFESLNVCSPNWGTEPLPSTKSMSPPRLMMPDDHSADVKPPTINAPDGDGSVEGPQFNIVPATPVGGGASAANPTHTPTMHQGSALNLQQQQWRTTMNQQSAAAAGQSFKQEFTFPPSQTTSSNDNFVSTVNTSITSPPHLGQVLDDSAVGSHSFLGVPPRGRSKSDTSREHPIWSQPFQQQQPLAEMGGTVMDEATVNMNDVLQQPQLNPEFTFGQGGSKLNNFLSPDLNSSIRRAKSEAGSRPVHRQSRSETIRGSNMLPSTPQPAHQHAHSSSGQFLIPPVGRMDYLSPNNSQQFYNGGPASPDGPLPSISGGSSMSPGRSPSASPGHIRRTSSGQHRVSPYPSPHTSPNPRVKDLPYEGGLEYNGGVLNVDGNLGFSQHQGYNSAYGGLSGSYSPTSTAASAYHTPGQSPSPGPPLTLENAVPKPTVTTGRTANASHRRRKQDAPFVCPVPGCGSTFTRSFNLKGHIRSHNEEKPFLCKWPACGKGFARQHDCKRHEQLHQNYRPFSCDGCGKQFARMDALNRHLRSDGGVDCLKLHEANAVAGKMTMNGRTNNENLDLTDGRRGGGGLGMTKVEDKAWAAAVAL